MLHIIYPLFTLLAILCILAATAVAYYYYQYHSCLAQPNIQCWNDWHCPGSPDWTPKSSVYDPITNNCRLTNASNSACTCDFAGNLACSCAGNLASGCAPT